MDIIWAKINPGEVYIGSNNRTILFGDIGPRHENKIEYSFEISSTPVKKEVAHKLLSSSEYQIASESGYHEVQLEVKANNTGAQRFYKLRGLTVRQELVGYYQSGLGYMMRGPLNP